ncbi:hypothetical protein [Agromyces sp. Marseille-P2726]|nr:hypothetical protein [Agromyces sp. Marseille-P2726]
MNTATATIRVVAAASVFALAACTNRIAPADEAPVLPQFVIITPVHRG